MTERHAHNRTEKLLAYFVICLTVVSLCPNMARAVAPANIITYQGRLLNDGGVPVADASLNMEFRLYDNLAGGTCLWSNSSTTCADSVARAVNLTDGLFTENLGDTVATYAAIADSTFTDNSGVYLEVEIAGETLTPRKRITAAAYAINSQSLDGLDSSAFLLSSGDTGTGAYDFSGATFSGASPLVFEGSVNNDYETTFIITEPTVIDKTITFKNETGTVAFTADIPGGASLWEVGTNGTYEDDAAVIVGADAAFTHIVGAAAGDLRVADALEVIGNSYFDGSLDADGQIDLGDNGDTFSVDSLEFDISGTTGSITINDGGNLGQLSVEGTILDINSLDFAGGGALTSTGAADITAAIGNANNLFNVLTGNLKVGNGANDTALNGEDVYIEGSFEVDGILDIDGAADFSAGLTNSAGELLVSGGNMRLNDAIALTFGTGNDLEMTWDDAAAAFEMDGALVSIGDDAGGATATGDNDLFVAGDFEVDGAADLDGNLSVADTDVAFDGAATTFTTTGAFTLTPGGAVILGDSGDTMYLNSSDWDISTAGAMTNIDSVSNTGAALALSTTDANNITMTPGAAANLVNILSGSLKVGDGAPTVAQDGEDVYIEGTLEVDGAVFFDGAETFSSDVDYNFVTTAANSENFTIAHTHAADFSISTIDLTFTDTAATDVGANYLLELNNADDGGATGTPDALVYLNQADANEAVANGIIFDVAAGGLTDAINAVDEQIVNALNAGTNDVAITTGTIGSDSTTIINFTDFDVSADGLITLAPDGGGTGITITPSAALTIGLDFNSTNIVSDIELQNNETVDNNTDDAIIITGAGGTNNTSLIFDLDGAVAAVPTIYSGNNDLININDGLSIGVDGVLTDDIADGGFSIAGGNDLYIADMLGVNGNSFFDGTANFAGAITTTGLANLDGGIAVDTDNFTVSGTTGATAILSSAVAGNLASISLDAAAVTGAITGLNVNLAPITGGDFAKTGISITGDDSGTATSTGISMAGEVDYGIDFDGATIGTADIKLENSDTISNATGGTIAVSGDFTVTGGDITVSGEASTFTIIDNTGSSFVLESLTDGLDYIAITTTDGSETITLGHGTMDSLTITTDGTGTAEIALPAGSIDSAEILDLTVASGDIANDTIDFDKMVDSLALDSATSITGTAGEAFQLTRTLTDATAENGMYITVTASDTTSSTTSQYGLLLDNAAAGEALDGVLVLQNTDADDAVVAGILFAAGGAGTDFTYGIDLDAANIGTADIRLENSDTISNAADDLITFTGADGTNNAGLVVDLDGATTTTPTLYALATDAIDINDSLLIGVDGNTAQAINDSGFSIADGDDLYVAGLFGVNGSSFFDASLNIADDTQLIIGNSDDATISWVNASNNFLFDNTNAAGSTLFQLGTDTNATDFQILNNSGAAIITVDGSGTTTFSGASPLVFEGTLPDDDYETTFTFLNPTADNAITFKNASGTVAFLTDVGGGGLWETGGVTGFTYEDDVAVIIGADAAFTHASGGVGDLRVADQLEVIGSSYFDGTLNIDTNTDILSLNIDSEATNSNIVTIDGTALIDGHGLEIVVDHSMNDGLGAGNALYIDYEPGSGNQQSEHLFTIESDCASDGSNCTSYSDDNIVMDIGSMGQVRSEYGFHANGNVDTSLVAYPSASFDSYLDMKGMSSVTGGTFMDIGFGAAATVSSNLFGININLLSNVTLEEGTDTVLLSLWTPGAISAVNDSAISISGVELDNSGTLRTTTADGEIYWNGVFIVTPDITQTLGTVGVVGLNIQNGTITTGGTQVGLGIGAQGVPAGTLTGIDISAISDGSGTETAIAIGNGWDDAINVYSGRFIVEVSGNVTTKGLLTFSPSVALTTAIDATDTDIVNALSVGDNTITGTTGVIDFTDFEVSADGLIILAPDGGGTGITITPSTALTTGLDLDSVNIVTDIELQNNEVIENNTNGTVAIKDGDTTVLISASKTALSLNLSDAQYTERLCHNGSDAATGVQNIGDCNPAGQADYAEMYPVASGINYGDIVVPGSTKVTTEKGETIVQMVKSTSTYQNIFGGVVVNNYEDGTSAGWNINEADNPMPVSLSGRVPVHVTNEGGSITIGDPITTSSTAGYGMKATEPGMIIGYALNNFSEASGEVMIFVHSGWYAGNILTTDGSVTLVSDTLVMNSLETASTATPSVASQIFSLRGSGWDGSTAQTLDMKIQTQVNDSDNYRLSIKNTTDSEIAYITNEGAMTLAGDLIVTGKFYPSDRGMAQTSKYIYYDGSAGLGGDMMRTNASGWSTGSYDFAEMFPSDEPLEAGDVVVFTGANENVGRIAEAYSTKIAGIVSARPGFLAGENKAGQFPVALAGRVPTKVNLENGNITVGDPLTTSSTAGYAMKAAKNSMIVGYALEPYTGTETDDKIIVFVNVGYFNGEKTETVPGIANTASLLATGASANFTSLNLEGGLYMGGNDVLNIRRLVGLGERWSIEEDGTIKTEGTIKTVINSYQNEKIETTAITSSGGVFVTLIGTAELQNGEAIVAFEDIDPNFNDITSTTAPIRVIVTPSGPVSLYVSEKNNNGFMIKQIGGSDSSVSVDWMVTAYRKDYEPIEEVIEPVEETTETTEIVATPETTEPVIEEPEIIEEPPLDPAPFDSGSGSSETDRRARDTEAVAASPIEISEPTAEDDGGIESEPSSAEQVSIDSSTQTGG